MVPKVREKELAIELRRKGRSYNEILRELAVAKSTLSLWLKDLPLTNNEKVYLKTRLDTNITRGRVKAATAHRINRQKREKDFALQAKERFEQLKHDRAFLVGVALYWAEGAKRDTTCSFMNSDADMVRVFVSWVEEFLRISRQDLRFRLYIHKPYAHEGCEEHWANYLGVDTASFKQTIYKPSGKGIKKRPNYKGCMRVMVPKSSKILFDLKVWQNMLAQEFK